MQDWDLDFQWDVAKAAANIKKHGVTFEQAAEVFLDPLAITVYDEAHSEREERWFTLGQDCQGHVLAVAHTFQAMSEKRIQVRIISARAATRHERTNYETNP